MSHEPQGVARPPDKGAPLLPTQVYGQASKNPMVQLSEGVFVSLLAACVLGFFAVLTSPEAAGAPSWGVALKTVRSALVSLVYALLAGTFYISYRAIVLTKPGFSNDRMAVDFIITLAIGIFFGVSLLHYSLCVPFLLLNILLASARQVDEHRRLVSFLSKTVSTENQNGDGTSVHRRDERSTKNPKDVVDKTLRAMANTYRRKRKPGDEPERKCHIIGAYWRPPKVRHFFVILGMVVVLLFGVVVNWPLLNRLLVGALGGREYLLTALIHGYIYETLRILPLFVLFIILFFRFNYTARLFGMSSVSNELDHSYMVLMDRIKEELKPAEEPKKNA